MLPSRAAAAAVPTASARATAPPTDVPAPAAATSDPAAGGRSRKRVAVAATPSTPAAAAVAPRGAQRKDAAAAAAVAVAARAAASLRAPGRASAAAAAAAARKRPAAAAARKRPAAAAARKRPAVVAVRKRPAARRHAGGAAPSLPAPLHPTGSSPDSSSGDDTDGDDSDADECGTQVLADELGRTPTEVMAGESDSDSDGGDGGSTGSDVDAPRVRPVGASRPGRAAAAAAAAATGVSIARKPPPSHPPSKAAAPTPAEAAERLSRTLYVGNVAVEVRRKDVAWLFAPYGPVESVRLRSFASADPKLPKRAAIATGALHASRDTLAAYVVLARGPADEATAVSAAAAPVEPLSSAKNDDSDDSDDHDGGRVTEGKTSPARAARQSPPAAVADRVAAAIAALNGSVWHRKHLRVDMAWPSAGSAAQGGEPLSAAGTDVAGASTVVATPEYDYKRCVFVGNLPFDVMDEELWELFSPPPLSQLTDGSDAAAVNGGLLGKDVARAKKRARRETKEVEATNAAVAAAESDHTAMATRDANRLDRVTAVRVVRDGASGMGKGFGYITFASPAGVHRVLSVVAAAATAAAAAGGGGVVGGGKAGKAGGKAGKASTPGGRKGTPTSATDAPSPPAGADGRAGTSPFVLRGRMLRVTRAIRSLGTKRVTASAGGAKRATATPASAGGTVVGGRGDAVGDPSCCLLVRGIPVGTHGDAVSAALGAAGVPVTAVSLGRSGRSAVVTVASRAATRSALWAAGKVGVAGRPLQLSLVASEKAREAGGTPSPFLGKVAHPRPAAAGGERGDAPAGGSEARRQKKPRWVPRTGGATTGTPSAAVVGRHAAGGTPSPFLGNVARPRPAAAGGERGDAPAGGSEARRQKKPRWVPRTGGAATGTPSAAVVGRHAAGSHAATAAVPAVAAASASRAHGWGLTPPGVPPVGSGAFAAAAARRVAFKNAGGRRGGKVAPAVARPAKKRAVGVAGGRISKAERKTKAARKEVTARRKYGKQLKKKSKK
ncbi:hypothetical protein MMPV_001665 [Pyropia vietnamensis]